MIEPFRETIYGTASMTGSGTRCGALWRGRGWQSTAASSTSRCRSSTTPGTDAVSASSTEKSAGTASGGNVAGAKQIGKVIAERAKEHGIKQVVFDRGGYLYHGRVKR